ncbi:AlbA family DNA-binding domain-containing protein [Streptomyces coelicoflavus]
MHGPFLDTTARAPRCAARPPGLRHGRQGCCRPLGGVRRPGLEGTPSPAPREGRWNELAKDVAAMANTRGGLIVFGVQDTTCELTGIDPAEVKPEQYAQWIRNHVHPYLSGLTSTMLTSPDGTRSVLVADVLASLMAPHLVYGTAARDKDQQAAVAPYRDRDHTAWMAEHQLERAYRDRFTRAAQTDDTLRQLVDHTRRQ